MLTLAIGLCITSLTLAYPPPWQPLNDIREVAQTHARSLVGDAAVQTLAIALDERLRLPRCDSPLEAFTSGNPRPGSAITVGVRCPQIGGWSVYVPVRLQIRREVLVSTRMLRRGEPVMATDLRRESRDTGQLNFGYFQDAAVITGQLLTRDIAPGTVIIPSALRRPSLVDRGQLVTLLRRLDGIEIRARGEALSDGAQAQRISVRNLSSGRVIEGIVRSADIVEVSG